MVISFDNKHKQKKSAVGKVFRSVDRHRAAKGRVVFEFVGLPELLRYREAHQRWQLTKVIESKYDTTRRIVIIN